MAATRPQMPQDAQNDPIGLIVPVPRKILVCGDRDWSNYDLMYAVLSQYPRNTILVNGYARGADKMSRTIAKELFDAEPRDYPADWTGRGNAAGPERNWRMLREETPDEVLAFHDDIMHSKGTLHCVRAARSLGIDVSVYSHGTQPRSYRRQHIIGTI